MKTIEIDGHLYTEGETVCMIPCERDERKLCPREIGVYVIEKITKAGYVYLRYNDRTCKFHAGDEFYGRRMSFITDVIQEKLDRSAYIQNTFKRIGRVNALNYEQAKAINNVLDKLGLAAEETEN